LKRHEIFRGPLCGMWPGAAVYLSLAHLADKDGRVEIVYRAISVVTGWPEDLLQEGITQLAKAGAIRQLYEKPEWGWEIIGFVSPRRLAWSEWASLRARVFERDDYTCMYCSTRGGRLECDHMIPISRGGTNEISNLTTACVSCNRSKRAKTPEEWLS